LKSIFTQVALGMGGVAAGAIITTKLVDSTAATKLLVGGAFWIGLLALALGALYPLSRRSAIAYLCFIGVAIAVGLTSILLGLSMPLFFLYGPSTAIGATLVGYFAAMLCYQARRGYLLFEENWEQRGEQLWSKFYNRTTATLMVEKLSYNLRFNADLLLPINNELVKGLVSLGLVVSMLAGLNLRHVFPEFSAFAWGIPSLTLSTVLIQMSYVRFLLAFQVWKLQKASGTIVAPDSRDFQ
jgi:hypothetical protein